MKSKIINAAIFFVALLSFVATSCAKQESPTVPTPPAYTNLSKSGTANCYIVSAAGDYRFTANIIGNGPSGIIAGGDFHTASATIAPESVELLWQDTTVITNVKLSYIKNQVIFKTANPFIEGNAVIAVKNSSGDILWSWHIWCTDRPANQVYQNDDEEAFTLLDRNLGETAGTSTPGTKGPDPIPDEIVTSGVFYQWGRKDPFSGTNAFVKEATSAMNGTIANTIKNPFTFYTSKGAGSPKDWHWYEEEDNAKNDYLWGNPTGYDPDYTAVKSIYDPCPPGYMVPPGEVWTNFYSETEVSNMDGAWSSGGNFFLQGNDNTHGTAWYPASGNFSSGEGKHGGKESSCWSSSPASSSTNSAEGLELGSGKDHNKSKMKDYDRAQGLSVRCLLVVRTL